MAYVRDDESPSLSVRGSTYVAQFVRARERPRVSLVFFEMDGPGARYLAIEGRARVADELDDEVYGAIVEPERQQDPDRNGVAVIIDVDNVVGATASGFFR